VPTGPGTAHFTLPSFGSGAVYPGGSQGITNPVPPPEPEPASGANVEVPTGDVTITSYAPSVEIKRAAKERFSKSPQAVIAEAENALAITVALEDILLNERSNSDEASKAKDLLKRQRVVLTDVISALQSSGDGEAARKSAVTLLEDLIASIITNLADSGRFGGLWPSRRFAWLRC